MKDAVTEAWHGTVGGYHNHGCRCPLCRAAQRRERERRKLEAREKMRERREASPRPPNPLVEQAAALYKMTYRIGGETRTFIFPPMGELGRDDDRG